MGEVLKPGENRKPKDQAVERKAKRTQTLSKPTVRILEPRPTFPYS